MIYGLSKSCASANTPQDALNYFLKPPPLDSDEKKCAFLSHDSPSILCRGDPLDENITLFRDGKLLLRGPSLWHVFGIGQHKDVIYKAAEFARKARFEFGETPQI